MSLFDTASAQDARVPDLVAGPVRTHHEPRYEALMFSLQA